MSGLEVACPECRHGVSLVKCNPCCALLAESGLEGRALWDFADVRCLESEPF